MSKKSAFPSKRNQQPKQPAPAEPRTKEEIQKDYYSLAAFAGEAYYKMKVAESQLSNFTNRIHTLDQEMSARENLDKQATARATESVPTQETSTT